MAGPEDFGVKSERQQAMMAPPLWRAPRPADRYLMKILWRWGCHHGAGAIEAPLCFAPLAAPDRQGHLGLAYPVTKSMFRSLNRLGLRIWGMPRQPRKEGFVS